jgi:hypothetical protein
MAPGSSDLLAHPAAVSGPIIVVGDLAVHQYLERLPVWRFVFADFDSQPMTVALNNLVNSSTGVKEYNVHFAGAISPPSRPHRLHRGRALLRARPDGRRGERITHVISQTIKNITKSFGSWRFCKDVDISSRRG